MLIRAVKGGNCEAKSSASRQGGPQPLKEMDRAPLDGIMTHKIPLRLNEEPLIETLWEIRFSSARPSVADLLPGLVFKELPDKYPNIIRLPAADIPAPIVEQDPSLKYVPKIRLEGGNQAVQIGEHVISLSCRRPYPGWETFSKDIRSVIEIVQNIGLIDRLERFSLKYVNLIDIVQPPDLTCLNVDLKIASYSIDIQPVLLRTEIKRNNIVHYIQIVSPAEASLPGEPRLRGVLLDIDSIRHLNENESWSVVDSQLDDVHLSSKEVFFNLLTPNTIDNLEPEYED